MLENNAHNFSAHFGIHTYEDTKGKTLGSHPLVKNYTFLGAFTQMRNAPISLVMSVRPHVAISATPTRQISAKFDIGYFYRNMSRKISFKSDKNTGHHLKIGTLYHCVIIPPFQRSRQRVSWAEEV
jgi:hypothetical protein